MGQISVEKSAPPGSDLSGNQHTMNWIKFWGRFARKHVTKREDKTFHSFRHAFIRALRRKKVSETMIKALVGHLDGDGQTSRPTVEI